MSDSHTNIVQMLLDRKRKALYSNKSQKRLFDIYAETKSVKDFTEEEVQFLFPETVKSTITIEFQKEGHIFASTHGDHTVKIIDFHTGRVIRTLVGHPRTPWAVKFHPRNPNILVSGCIGSVVIVWDWKNNEILAQTVIMRNVIISSLDWHPVEELILIACGTTVFIWDYSKNILINLFPTSVRQFRFAYFYGNDRGFIASYQNVSSGPNYTYTISCYQLIKDKYTKATVVYGCSDITKQSIVNCANGIHISKNGDYAIISVCETPQNPSFNLTAVPDIPRASVLQLQNRASSLSSTPSLPPLPAPAQNPRPQETVFHFTPIQTPSSQEDPTSRAFFTPPHPRAPSILHTPPLEPRDVFHEDMDPSLLQRPSNILFRNPPPAPTLRPAAVPVYEQAQMTRQISSPLYIAKVSLLGNTRGEIVSKFRIPDNAVVSSLQISPNNDFILTSYRIRGSKVPEPFQSIFFHIYRQLDWRLYYEKIGLNDNANIAVWSPLMDGLVVGTEKGKLYIFRSNICPLSRSRVIPTIPSEEKTLHEDEQL